MKHVGDRAADRPGSESLRVEPLTGLGRASRKAQEGPFLRIRKISCNILEDHNSKTFEARSVRCHDPYGILRIFPPLFRLKHWLAPSLTTNGFPDTIFLKGEEQ